MEKTLRDILAKELKILFIGFNPGLYSAKIGHYFAHKNNKFWDLLYQSALTPKRLDPREDWSMLSLGYGLTDIVKRPSKGIGELKRREYTCGKMRLRKIIEEYKPKIACYLGTGVYKEFSGQKEIKLGLQESNQVEGVLDFVAPSTSGLNMIPFQEKLYYFKQLRSLLN